MVLKTTTQKPKVASKASRKKPLPIPEYGAKLLRQAIPMLQLTTEEATLLRAIARRNDAGVRPKEKQLRHAESAPPSVVKAAPAAPAATSTTAAKAQCDKQLAKTRNTEELKRLDRLRRARIKAERESLHSKSKFTTYARRAPGSFEGGKR